ncbi:hypothetical protein K1T71_001366 [Dendrolimus kikuchii]|uniref:Uncharacterized protein n=1 Tax=Dendrolimus kikuchii TaxID=765133 RepID=A0ACC1DHK7_9NEOP|nr:hypothetical protein K1T71_001366 [Dendrolimus kikuchii]
MYRIFALFCVVSVFKKPVSGAYAEHSPCKIDDSKCLTEYTRVFYDQFVEGDEKLGVKSSDPLNIDRIEGNLSDIHYTLTDSVLRGLKNCDFKSVEASEKDKQVTFRMYYPKALINGHYNVNGSLLGMRVYGDGPYMFELREYWINVTADVEKTTDKDGLTTIQFKKFKIEADLRGGFDFKVDNLLDGNKKLVESLFKVVRQNWKLLVDLFQMGPLEIGYKKLFQNMNKSLKHIPIDKFIQQ